MFQTHHIRFVVRRYLTLIISICLILSVKFGTVQAERWSRQVSNSEWIPLTNPRATQTQVEQNGPTTGLLTSGSAQLPQLPQLSLPSALQQQYQEQLLQLQKTQENIQKLLLLQQQLRAQQQLLQSQTFLPSGFSNADEEKQLHQGGLGSSQVANLASEDLVPPLPASEALPPAFPAQNFLPQRPRPHAPTKQDASLVQEFSNLPGQDFKNSQLLQQSQNVGNIEQIEENQRQGAKQMKQTSHSSLPPQGESGQDEEEEVQLVYVPAETLAQRGQPKRGRGRKQYPSRQQQQQQQQHQQPQQTHQHHENQGVDGVHEQDTLAREILQQIQLEREEKAQFLKEERMKEIARLNEEQRALERKARLQQEALQREQEIQRQREAEKKKKELEKLEELAKQRELERIREAREKQRLEELERRRLAEVRAKEEKRRAEEAARQREAERLAVLERQKELDIQQALKQQEILEKQRERETSVTGPERSENQNVQAQALPLIRDQHQQFHRQHFSEAPKQSKTKIRGRQRQRTPSYQDQQNYRQTTTTPSPNQPPLSVYMAGSNSKTANIKVSDVLRILKDAKTIAVLDTVGPDTPQVFVGPTSLEPPIGYAKFDLPYLSSIDHNRVERKVDKLPFFVAPLSFDPPPGYSKIPFPAPHIGSVVVNTLDNTDPKETDNHNPSPTPLIEPNSYLDGLNSESNPTTPLYEPQTTISYSPELSSTPKYEQPYSATPSPGYSGSKFRFRQYYNDNKPASVISTSYYDDQRSTVRKQKYYDENLRTTEIPVQSSKVETSLSHAEEVSYSTTPSFKEETIGQQDPSGQLALINQQLAQQRETQGYNTDVQYSQHNPQVSTGLTGSFDGEITAGDINDVRAPVGPTQYSLPAELPAISPHLPGLVNSLLDKNEAKLQAGTTTTTTSTTTTTTTTPRTPTTTYRPRSRQRSRIVSTRPKTTTEAPATRANVDRSRRPYNRSRSRFTTTTEEYRESAYEPTKSKIPETTLRYNVEHRRPVSRTHKYRSRDKTSQQSEVLGHAQNVQTQQSYDTVSHSDSNSSTSNTFLPATGSDTSGSRQLDSSSNLNDYAPENYPSTTVSTTENYPPLHDVTVNHGSAMVSEDYSRSQNYPQNIQEEPHYRPNYDQSTLEQTGLEHSPVNGFNYQAQNEESLDQGIIQRPKNYQLDGKVENSDFELATTVDPRFRASEDERYSPIYEVNVPQPQSEYTLTGQDNLHRVESEKIQSAVADANPNEDPIFIPLPENKQEDYELPVSSTEISLSDITLETTTTSTTPVVIRQRVRGRVGTRPHHESSVQTRNRGSQDEYVRFNVVKQDSTRTSPSRQRVRSRSRTQNHGSHTQTDDSDYIKIHAVQQQRSIATTTPTPSTTTTTVRPTEEDIDYGFIRPPNFRPVHPVDNRYQAPVTYRPQFPEVPQQSLLPNDETAVESNPPQTQLLKNRQKYQPTPSRRLPPKPTTLPPPTTTPETITTTERIPVATVLPDDAIYTAKSKSRTDETKQTRVRSRVRRPGRKRVTTTSTESVLEAHNELPLDENYPPIRPQPVTTEQQQSLYDDNYDSAGGFSGGTRNPTGHQFYETSSENYPPEFLLNFGNYPAQQVQREEYDQTQLASNAPRRYTQASRARPSPEDDHPTTADIYGAESQWSTKLTRASFQPSFAVNQVPGEISKGNQWFHESLKDSKPPEIITAAPEPSSVTLVVSSNDKKIKQAQEDEDESMLLGTTIFGRKTSVQDHTEKMNSTETTTVTPVAKQKNGNVDEASQDKETWQRDRVESSTEQQSVDIEKIEKKNDNPTTVKKTARRRRVRIRVRPTVDDFVTAESQHFNSALNGLFRNQYKYSPIRESKLPAASSSPPEKSVLQDFLTEILKNDEPTKITTTEVPEVAWTMSPAMTTPIVMPEDVDGTTEIQITTMPTTYKTEEATITETPYKDLFAKLVQEPRDIIKVNDKEEKQNNETKTDKEEKEQKTWGSMKKWNQKSAQNTLNFDSIAGKYRAKNNDVNKSDDNSDRVPGVEELTVDEKKSERKSDVVETPNEMDEGNSSEFSEHNEERQNGDYNYPKNHRAKWSEVRYPSAFEHSKTSWSYDSVKTSGRSGTSSIPGLITKNEGDTSVKTLSDYVQAIFDTMKSAEEETTMTYTEDPDDIITTTQPPLSEMEFPIHANESEQEELTINDAEVKTTTQLSFEETETTNSIGANDIEVTQTIAPTTDIDLDKTTTLGRIDTISDTTTSSSSAHLATDPPLSTTLKPNSTTVVPSNSTESILGKVLRTSTTTRVSHMTEICYRGRCVMTRPSRDDRFR
ncbi:PREDICTED: serine-rich adhesin for platelets-like [Eufriesea mexicana]|uniref:serine-rich adhesin for platelets-like n=1 Tax=Eufriesea mexicana TaxID=516756 RepID=UPI00083BD617|nr:PREDICTED: serine-rich adhesin for platelets-like [Eufriesea mexicana]